MPLLYNPKVSVIGTGIGSFGSYESVLYESEVYEKIDFPEHFKMIMSTANKKNWNGKLFFYGVN